MADSAGNEKSISTRGLELFSHVSVVNLVNIGFYGSSVETNASCFGKLIPEIVTVGVVNGSCEVYFSDVDLINNHLTVC